MEDIQKELKEVLEALKTEEEEDKRLYLQKIKNASVEERKEEGLTWYPLQVNEVYYGRGEMLFLEVERTNSRNKPHQFSTGKSVYFFTNDNDEPAGIAGVVSAVRQNSLKIALFSDEPPEWIKQGKLGVDVLFDETSYREMERAMELVINARNCRLAELRQVLTGVEKPQVFTEQPKINLDTLNESQNLAMNNALSAADVAIIHGPPGTGKTTTLVETVRQILKEEEQVLVCAPSNTAVDLLTEKFAEKGVNVLRIGNPARVNEKQLRHTVDVQVSEHKDFKRIKDLRKSAAHNFDMAHRYKRKFGKEERQQRNLLFKEAKSLQREAADLEQFITDSLIEKARVITCTLVGATNFLIRNREFSTCLIDEAAQAPEPATWIPVTKAERVIFAGDHWQLPPTVKSQKAEKMGLGTTLFEKCIKKQDVDVMLRTQYRMNEKIMEFSNKEFYKGQLIADESIKDHVLDKDNETLSSPLEYIDTAGCGFEEKQDPRTLSTSNEEEAGIIIQHLKALISELHGHKKVSIGIITPYRAQVEVLERLVLNENIPGESPVVISVNTVDGFQGQERDVIYISLVRNNDKGEVGFLSDIRRMNVALTRARKKLVVTGDSATLGSHRFYQDFLNYVESAGSYRTAWEWIA